MQERKVVTHKERLGQLMEKLTPNQQAAVVSLLETMASDRCCECEEKLAKAPPGSTLWEAGIDAQDWVDHLRGKRCG